MTRSFPIPPLALIFAIVSCGVGYKILTAGPQVELDSALPAQSTTNQIVAKNPFLSSALSREESADIIANISGRPLFSATRKAPEMNSAEAEEPAIAPPTVPEPLNDPVLEAAPPSLPPELQVRGFIRLQSKPSVLIHNLQDQTEQWMKAGDQIMGWTLVEITQGGIILRFNDTEMTMKIFE